MTCTDCDKPMRPRNTTAARYPGTVLCNGVRCTMCASKATSNNARQPGQKRPCKRCGVMRKARPGAVLCADCRAVLKPAERKLWAA